ncbi:Patulin cluster transcription factor patL [Fusarium oxysporum f. sp. rapae]|uniref:Patulin cluster transcription factor patL n=1 Tax=Fusarium oxysporum f. sp. rapae TaxID=485398 RepID=A0A8J5TSV1_FUSOX|nr:Patulin cluster transcription factor patL [Fusarium oxysporum f. sp. rapae]
MGESHKAVPRTRVRSKRAQYVNQACTYCRRRKTKCDGEQPCGGCSSLRKICEYEIPRSQPKSTLANSRDRITASVHTIGSDNTASNGNSKADSDPSTLIYGETKEVQSMSDTLQSVPEFCGPSSSEFAFKAVSGNLREMGMPSAILSKLNSDYGILPEARSHFSNYGPFMKLVAMDPLWDISKTDAVILVKRWFTNMGRLYPFLREEELLDTIHRVYAVIGPISVGTPIPRRELAAEALLNDETNKLKIVLAVSKTMQDGGRNDQAQRLFQSTTEAVESLIWNPSGISGIQLLVLTAIYHYQLDDEVRTGRMIGLAARLCLEIGLHRHPTIKKVFANHEDRATAMNVFWSVYMLERRICLGQGIPYSIQNSYVDQSLFLQDNSDPVLRCLLQWTKLVGRAWKVMNIDGENGAEVHGDELEYLDSQASQWYDELPQNLKLDASLGHSEPFSTSLFVQAALYLRQSLLRNLIFRPVLQSGSRIGQHEDKAHVAVALAKDAVSTLCRLSAHRTFIFSHVLFFKHLLVAAFGNILLAVVHAHAIFWDTVRTEFEQALDLIQLLSTRSHPMVQLWQRLQGLRELPARLNGLSNPAVSSDTQTRPNEDRGRDSSLPGLPTDTMFFNSTLPLESLSGDFAFLMKAFSRH